MKKVLQFCDTFFFYLQISIVLHFFIEAPLALGIEVKSPEPQNSKFSKAKKATNPES